MATSSPEGSDLSVPWSNVVRFVRQVSHDLRNDLNAAELQAAFIGELAGEDAELKAEVTRLREVISKLALTLQKLAASLGQISPTMMAYRVSDFMEDLREKVAKDFPAENAEITWEIKTGDENFEVDPQLLQQALLELLGNAFQHERGKGAVSVQARIDNGKLVVTLREPKAGFALSVEKWGREPLNKVSQGHYGLGLNRVRVILEAHGGELGAKYDSAKSELVTTVMVPVSVPEK